MLSKVAVPARFFNPKVGGVKVAFYYNLRLLDIPMASMSSECISGEGPSPYLLPANAFRGLEPFWSKFPIVRVPLEKSAILDCVLGLCLTMQRRIITHPFLWNAATSVSHVACSSSDFVISSPHFVFSPWMDLLLRTSHVLVGVHCPYLMLLEVFIASEQTKKKKSVSQ